MEPLQFPNRIQAGSSALDPAAIAERRVVGERRASNRRWQYGLAAVAALGLVAVSGTIYYRAGVQQQIDASRGLQLQIGQLRTELESLRTETQASIEQQIQDKGLFSVSFLKEKSQAVLELRTYWNKDKTVVSHGSAIHVGNGYFLTVKHALYARSNGSSTPFIWSTASDITWNGKKIPVRVVDYSAVEPEKYDVIWGDWALVKSTQAVQIPTLNVRASYPFEYNQPIARIGNDWGFGIIPAASYLGNRLPSGLYTSLMVVHEGISGGAIIDYQGDLIGVSIGKQNGGDNFAYIQPVIPAMLRKIPHLKVPPAS
jgi:hypothetical protein